MRKCQPPDALRNRCVALPPPTWHSSGEGGRGGGQGVLDGATYIEQASRPCWLMAGEGESWWALFVYCLFVCFTGLRFSKFLSTTFFFFPFLSDSFRSPVYFTDLFFYISLFYFAFSFWFISFSCLFSWSPFSYTFLCILISFFGSLSGSSRFPSSFSLFPLLFYLLLISPLSDFSSLLPSFLLFVRVCVFCLIFF